MPRPVEGLPERWERALHPGIAIEIDETTDELLPVIGAHARIAVGAEGFCPAFVERHGLVDERLIAGRATEADHAAQQLAEDHGARRLAPALHVGAGRR